MLRVAHWMRNMRPQAPHPMYVPGGRAGDVMRAAPGRVAAGTRSFMVDLSRCS
jgi:hypothetical protein